MKGDPGIAEIAQEGQCSHLFGSYALGGAAEVICASLPFNDWPACFGAWLERVCVRIITLMDPHCSRTRIDAKIAIQQIGAESWVLAPHNFDWLIAKCLNRLADDQRMF